MKATTAIGIVVAFVGLAVGATMEGSQIPWPSSTCPRS